MANEPKLSSRQQFWLDESNQDAQRPGRELASGFFLLLALPNEKEMADEKCAD